VNATVMAGKHKASEPKDVHYLKGAWHIGVHPVDHFPMSEVFCPCPKADCGLAIPVAAIPCTYHHGALCIAQYHRADQCPRAPLTGLRS
jgi:hypothetical protein